MCSCWWDILSSIWWNIVCGTYGERNRDKKYKLAQREIRKYDETQRDEILHPNKNKKRKVVMDKIYLKLLVSILGLIS